VSRLIYPCSKGRYLTGHMRCSAMMVLMISLKMGMCAALRTSIVSSNPPITRPASPMASVYAHQTNAKPPLQLEVEQTLRLRTFGLAFGLTLVGLASCAAVHEEMITLPALFVPASLAAAFLGLVAWMAVTLSYEEHRPPLCEEMLVVRPSPGKGNGLFAAAPIAAGTFLFDYQGEVLRSLDELFERYPDGRGAYIACVNSEMYIDGADPESGLARWMNHRRRGPTVQARKQRFGPSPAMHFYAARDVAGGEELVFDYGDEYWDAMGITPLPE